MGHMALRVTQPSMLTLEVIESYPGVSTQSIDLWPSASQESIRQCIVVKALDSDLIDPVPVGIIALQVISHLP